MRSSSAFLAALLGLSAIWCGRDTEYRFAIPVESYRLENGLTVVVSPDRTAPLVTVGVYYRIGFRSEPQGRTGFAHLFEHMMFQGSGNLGKMEFTRLVQASGGFSVGYTHFDFTNYFTILPSHKLETILWAEADRMRGLDVSEENLANQKAVVTNEVLVNVLNQPYGGFPWLDMPQAANTNWYNAHNFYGELQDLQAATLDEVRGFFSTYYAPNNAAIVISGDVEPADVRVLVRNYFGALPSAPQPTPVDVTEPRQESFRRAGREDPRANRPALAVAYHMPPRGTPEYYAMGLLDQILLQGDDSMLGECLVRHAGATGAVGGGINTDLGTMFTYDGPMLWSFSLFHDATVKDSMIVSAVDSVINEVRGRTLDEETLSRARRKFRSTFYSQMSDYFGLNRLNTLASFALFDGDAARINAIEERIEEVSPELLRQTAQEYLRKTNQTVLTLTPPQGEPDARR